MSNTRKAIRQEVARLLAGTNMVVGTASGDGAAGGTTLIDYNYRSTTLQDGHFANLPIYLTSGMWAGLWRRVYSYTASTGTYTFDEAFQFAADGTGVTTNFAGGTLTDARQSWTTNQYVGATVTCNTKTLTVTSNTDTVLTGTGGWSADPGAGNSYTITYPIMTAVEYEIHPTIQPERINEAIDRALRKMLYDTITIPGHITDGDMEDSATTAYTAGAGATLTKTTPVARGAYALKVAGDATCDVDLDAYAYQAVSVVEGDSYFVWAFCKNEDATTSCKLVAYDVTNGAEIDSETSTQLPYVGLGFQFEIPSDCKQIQIRLQTLTASKYSMWDHVQLLRHNERDYLLPNTWLNETWQVGRTVYQCEGANLSGDTRQVFEYPAVEWPHIYAKKWSAIDVAITPSPPFNNNAPVYIRCLRHYSALSSDSSTTDADLDWVAAKAKYECLRMLAAPLVPSEERGEFRKALEEAKMEAAAMDARFMPKIDQPFGFGSEQLFSLQEV